MYDFEGERYCVMLRYVTMLHTFTILTHQIVVRVVIGR